MALVDSGNLLVWNTLKLYLPEGTRLSSVYRPAQAQLDFIVKAAKKEKYKFRKEPVLGDRSSWIGALEHLRKLKYKIAEPGRSKHQQGIAYDLAGPDLAKIEAAVRRAVADGSITLARKSANPILVETKNRCVHVE